MLICADSNERAYLRPIPGPNGHMLVPDEECPGPAPLAIDASAERNRTSMLTEIEHFLATIPPDSATERRLATVLAIGLSDSAAIALRLGHEQWQTYRKAFDHVVRGQVQRFLGTISYELVGGVVATFDSTARAIRCAATIASAARQADLAVRAGVHVGELEWLESGPTGVAIEVANSIFELSGSGEILVSSTVRDLVAGSGIQFEPVASSPAAIAEQGWGGVARRRSIPRARTAGIDCGQRRIGSGVAVEPPRAGSHRADRDWPVEPAHRRGALHRAIDSRAARCQYSE